MHLPPTDDARSADSTPDKQLTFPFLFEKSEPLQISLTRLLPSLRIESCPLMEVTARTSQVGRVGIESDFRIGAVVILAGRELMLSFLAGLPYCGGMA